MQNKKYDIPNLTKQRASTPSTIIHKAIAILANAPNQIMKEQVFLEKLGELRPAPRSPASILQEMTSDAPKKYGNVLQRHENYIRFTDAWWQEIQKYKW